MADKDISKPYQQNLRAKVGANIRSPSGVGIGGTIGVDWRNGVTVSPNVGFSQSGWGVSVDPTNGDVTRSIPLPYSGYGEYKTGKDAKRAIGLGVRAGIGKAVAVKAGIESESKGDIAFPGEFGTTKIAPNLYTKTTRLGTVDEFGYPQVQVDSYAELANGKKVRVRRDKVSVPVENIDDMLYGDIDRKGPGSFPTKDVTDAFHRALQADPDLFAGTPDISRNAFDTGRFPLGNPLNVVGMRNGRDGIASVLMNKAKDLVVQPQTAANMQKIGRALWAARGGRIIP